MRADGLYAGEWCAFITLHVVGLLTAVWTALCYCTISKCLSETNVQRFSSLSAQALPKNNAMWANRD